MRKITYKDETLPHQIDLKVNGTGGIYAICNCGWKSPRYVDTSVPNDHWDLYNAHL